MHKPVISGPWQLLYKPQNTGSYVNDHSIIKGYDGQWHLFGITRKGPGIVPSHERYFTHGAGPALISENGLEEKGIVCDNGVTAWAPAVIADDGRYYMYYGPSPLKFATSDEMSHWMENPVYLHDSPLDACHRDPMVIKVGENRWLMYATALWNKYGQVSVYESSDLVNWHFIQYALRTSGKAPINPPWAATESPFVVQREDGYYLFVTYTDSRRENYHNTLVFYSKDPSDFGDYQGNKDVLVTTLPVHAPEVIQDPDSGNWFITTCGWPGQGIPIEGAVAIAPLSWV